jgi:exosortase C (VPDSG-CTERM-specific)
MNSEARSVWHQLPVLQRRPVGRWMLWIAAATLAFAVPLTRLMLHAMDSELHSYIPLVPFVAGYLLYIRRPALRVPHRRSTGGAVVFSGVALAALASWFAWRGSLSVNDGLAVLALAYVSFVAAGGFLLLGSKWMAAAAFPVVFLLLLVPLPDAAVTWLEQASVLASAEVSAFLFHLTGTPLLRDGTRFMLPGIVIMIAQECSGIHSSWVLFITSLVASHLFLAGPWSRILLVALVIPLGIVRNGFRILVIGLLCAHYGPEMIDSAIHRHGGPLFFALSLVPMFGLLLWLRHRQR